METEVPTYVTLPVRVRNKEMFPVEVYVDIHYTGAIPVSPLGVGELLPDENGGQYVAIVHEVPARLEQTLHPLFVCNYAERAYFTIFVNYRDARHPDSDYIEGSCIELEVFQGEYRYR